MFSETLLAVEVVRDGAVDDELVRLIPTYGDAGQRHCRTAPDDDGSPQEVSHHARRGDEPIVSRCERCGRMRCDGVPCGVHPHRPTREGSQQSHRWENLQQQVDEIVCYGIGNFSTDHSARCQLQLFLILRQLMKVMQVCSYSYRTAIVVLYLTY